MFEEKIRDEERDLNTHIQSGILDEMVSDNVITKWR
jgi:hypothetical protein